MVRRTTRDRSDAAARLQAAADSAQPLQAWARAHGLGARSLHAWWPNLSGRPARPARAAPVPSLRPARLVPVPPSATSRHRLRVGGAEVELGGWLPDDSLRRVLAAVARC